jgi:hypothetical protein
VIRRVVAGLLVLAVAAAGLSAQDRKAADPDEPPVRLKKKERPKTPEPQEPARPKDEAKPADAKKPPEERLKKGDEPPDQPDQPEVDEDEVLNRVLKNSHTVEERLAKMEADEKTQQYQRDILKDLESLIRAETANQQNQDQEQAEEQQQQSEKGKQQGKPQNGKPQAGKQQPKQSPFARGRGRQQQQQMAGEQRGRRHRRLARGNRPGRQQGDQQANDQPNQGGGGGKANQGGNGGKSPTEENRLADVYKDVWGELPRALRGEMNAYSREEFMDKYKDVLKKYYATIAEKGRRKN